jgi:excisionase family DNA binding protein
MPSSDDERLAYSVPETARRVGVTRQHIHNLIARGEIRSVKVGRSRRIPIDEVHRLAGVEHVRLAARELIDRTCDAQDLPTVIDDPDVLCRVAALVQQELDERRQATAQPRRRKASAA